MLVKNLKCNKDGDNRFSLEQDIALTARKQATTKKTIEILKLSEEDIGIFLNGWYLETETKQALVVGHDIEDETKNIIYISGLGFFHDCRRLLVMDPALFNNKSFNEWNFLLDVIADECQEDDVIFTPGSKINFVLNKEFAFESDAIKYVSEIGYIVNDSEKLLELFNKSKDF